MQGILKEAYAKGKEEVIEFVTKTCDECSRTQYKRGRDDEREHSNYHEGWKDGRADLIGKLKVNRIEINFKGDYFVKWEDLLQASDVVASADATSRPFSAENVRSAEAKGSAPIGDGLRKPKEEIATESVNSAPENTCKKVRK
jgi:hypothetical protein